MVFFAQKVLRKVAGNWTFVVVTDRVELDDQIAKTFKATGAVSESEGEQCHAASGAHLRELLRGNHRYVLTLIHKFQTPELLCDRPDVIMLTDETHRSQYDTLALNVIESYNTGSRNMDQLFEELVKLSRNLSEEQQRHVRENMTEEELVIFDILTRPAPELSAAQRAEVKKVSRELLNKLKLLLVLNWRQKSSARSQLKLTI
jgi:type I site-specific restriction-modification system R (restriction) subunit